MWTIGQLAARNEVGVETGRYYERIGLLEQPSRPRSGRRIYTMTHERRLRFVSEAKRLGYSLNDIAELLAIAQEVSPHRRSELAADRLGHVRHTLACLRSVESALVQMIEACPGKGDLLNCPIIAALVEDGSPVDDLPKRTA